MNHNKLFSIIFSATAVCLPIAANGTAIGHDTVTETDFKTKEAYTGDSLATAWLNAQTGLTPEERDAIKFLYAYMPLADGNGYAPEFFLANVRSSLRAAEEMPWGKTVPHREFRHFVLPVRVNNESLDLSRPVFYKELKDRVKGMEYGGRNSRSEPLVS